METLYGSPVLVALPQTYKWRLGVPYEVLDEVLGKVHVPEGFITDLGSIPRLFWSLVPPFGPGTPAYLVHDWLYAKQGCKRIQVDDCLLRLLTALKVDYFSRYAIYWNVRTFGWFAWRGDRINKAGGK